MPEWIRELVIAIGGGATVAFALLTILKSIVLKIADKAIDTSFEKSTLKLSNKLERTTRAYEILLKKEFEYYERIDPYMAMLVPLVQDLEYWATKSQEGDYDKAKEMFREQLLEYIDMIPKIKNDSVLFQPYIPESVFDAVAMLVKNMQADLQFLKLVCGILFGETEGEIDTDKLKEISGKVLKSIALIETIIKNRLVELTGN